MTATTAPDIPTHPAWLQFVNVSDPPETIPAGAVVEPAGGYDRLGRVRVRQCTADGSLAVYFNSPMAVEAGSPGLPDEAKPGGLCRPAFPLGAAAVHPEDLEAFAPPVAAGARAGDWFLRLAGKGFRFLDPPADGLANVLPDPVTEDQADPFPQCAEAGSGSGSGADGPCVVWFTKYMHLGAVAVQAGEFVSPGQLVGYLAYQTSGAHLHFSLGDGQPLIWPGFNVPIAGRLTNVTDWFGYPIVGPRVGCQRGGMGGANFDDEVLAYIRARFQTPMRGDGWRVRLGSPFHCDWEYDAVDLSTGDPAGDWQVDIGKPVYAAVKGADVVTTVETVWRGGDGAYAVLLRHQTACCNPEEVPGSGSGIDLHNPRCVQYPCETPVAVPPPGVPKPYQAGSFEPVTRLCLGKLPPLAVVGNFSEAEDGPPAYIQLDPAQFEFHNGWLRIKPALLVGEVTFGGGGGQTGLLPVTVEKTAVTVPTGVLIGRTTCSPPATSCCDGPKDPCPTDEWDPLLPVVLSLPAGADCAPVELTGEISWRDGQWRYEGFLQGVIPGDPDIGVTVDVQLEWLADDSEAGGSWWLLGQFVGVGDERETAFAILLEPDEADGTTLVGTAVVDRPDCSDEASATVGHPCPAAGWPGGAWDPNAPATFTLEGCGELPYPRRLTATWFDPPSGTCGCFIGEFTMVWDDVDRWIGVFRGCPHDVTVEIIYVSTAGDVVFWDVLLTSPNYSFATSITTSECGTVPPQTSSITITGGCSGASQLFFS
jgi:hypothetical protein